MSVSVFDMFSVGLGPSSSHTVGPMSAAADFVACLAKAGFLEKTRGLEVDLYGSLAATGRGHGTFGAVLLGLEGFRPATARPEDVERRLDEIAAGSSLRLGGTGPAIAFNEGDLRLRPLTFLPEHSNAMQFAALGEDGTVFMRRKSFSIGGGFVVHEGEDTDKIVQDRTEVPHPFKTGEELRQICERERKSIAQIALENEKETPAQVREKLLHLWQVMEESKQYSLTRTGVLPGGLRTKRRAPAWYERLQRMDPHRDPKYWLEWVNLVALAVNEENASGGRIVTAPTNGAAGIIPATLFYALNYTERAAAATDQQARADIVCEFLLAAGAIGSVIKEQSSISGAEVGCQGEVGSASSMAAAGLAQVCGGSAQQILNAAEIAMEHHLGLTCDPVGGLVQVPCIERNAIAAGTAINASRMALFDDCPTMVSLDTVVRTMKKTGEDMSTKYKETATGGLAVTVVEC
ncbi:MAG: L-serine ammonia-lyase [Actinomycetaceae bacterium]|nr:L-serine ammonia-lyase [Actinomycetaceae bacterium]